jgi:hypothetical protein
MRALSNVLELLGLAVVGFALYLLDWRLLVAYLGVLVVVAGLILDPPRRRP